MSATTLVVVVVGLALLAALVLWARGRQPRSIESGIEEFRREMNALAPERSGTEEQDPPRRRSSRRPPRQRDDEGRE